MQSKYKRILARPRNRHILKTVTWRILASITTFALSYAFFYDSPEVIAKATGMAISESIIKMLMYYGHERAWFRVEKSITAE